MIVAKCTRGDGTRVAPDISEPLISSMAMAQARGKRFLDDPSQGAYYLTETYSLTIPHKSANVKPGVFVEVTEAKSGLNAELLKIKSYTISGTPKSVYASGEFEKYMEV